MPIYREVELSDEIKITMKDIAEDITESDAIKLISLLMKKFPNIATNLLIKEKKKHKKLFPESQKKELIQNFQNKYKSINELNIKS